MKGNSILENVGNDIISYSRAKEIVTAYENQMIEETYKNNLAREQGIEQGQAVRNIEIAKAMLEENLEIEIISKCTGLSVDEIKNI